MATHADVQPATLPLPGGSEGATVRLHPLLTGTMGSPRGAMLREEGRLAGLKALGVGVPQSSYIRLPSPAFWVEHPSAGNIMIDTGFHPSVAVDPKQSLGRLFTFVFRDFEMDPSQAAAGQLRAANVDPASVTTVLMTHLHADHASAMSEFPGATFVFSDREWESATDQGPTHGYRKQQFDHAFDYRTVDFEAPEADSFASFGRSVDLFGDGSVRLVATPGHTNGHMSVVLRLNGREALIAGDAIYMLKTLTHSHMPPRTEDEHNFRRSLREIQLYAEQTPGALIIPGHDIEFWNKLDPVYE